jgi:hypothetical protein
MYRQTRQNREIARFQVDFSRDELERPALIEVCL